MHAAEPVRKYVQHPKAVGHGKKMEDVARERVNWQSAAKRLGLRPSVQFNDQTVVGPSHRMGLRNGLLSREIAP
jgi:hypothetical protein